MSTTLAAAVARLEAELAGDALCAPNAAGSPATPLGSSSSLSSFASSLPSLKRRSRSRSQQSGIDNLSAVLLDEPRILQRYASLDMLASELATAPAADLRAVQEVATTMLVEKAARLGDSFELVELAGKCLVTLLERGDSRFTDETFSQMLERMQISRSESHVFGLFSLLRHLARAFPLSTRMYAAKLLVPVRKALKTTSTPLHVRALQTLLEFLPELPTQSQSQALLGKVLAKASLERSASVRSIVAQCLPFLQQRKLLLNKLLKDLDEKVWRASGIAFAQQSDLSEEGLVSSLHELSGMFESERSRPAAVWASMELLKKACHTSLSEKTLANVVLRLITCEFPVKDSTTARCCVYVVSNSVVKSTDSSVHKVLCRVLLNHAQKSSIWCTACCLAIVGDTIGVLGQAAHSLKDELLDVILTLLSSPSFEVRMTASGVLSSFALSVPSQTATILRVLQNVASIHIAETRAVHCNDDDRISAMCSLHGHCESMAALLSCLPQMHYGVPSSILSAIFSMAESLLQTFSGALDANSSYLSLLLIRSISESGWSIISALVSLGPQWSSSRLKPLFYLFKLYTKRSAASGQSFAQQLGVGKGSSANAIASTSVYMRSCCASALHAFVTSASTEEIISHPALLKPILALLFQTVSLLDASKGSELKVGAELKRLKAVTFLSFAALPTSLYQGRFVSLLHMCVAEFSARAAPTTTALVELLQRRDDAISPAGAFAELCSRQEPIEPTPEDVHGTPYCPSHYVFDWGSRTSLLRCPSANQKLVDASLLLFAHVFPEQSTVNQTLLLAHLESILSQPASLPSSVRNIACAFLGLAMALARSKAGEAAEAHMEASQHLLPIVVRLLQHSDTLVLRAASEAAGLFARLQPEPFTQQLLGTVINELDKGIACFVLSCIHRCLGAFSTIRLLDFSVQTLLDVLASSSLRLVVLHSLYTVTEVAGFAFSSHSSRTLTSVFSALLKEDMSLDSAMALTIGKILNALLGPELVADSKLIWMWRTLCAYDDPLVRVEVIRCVEQFALWASATSVQEEEVVAVLKRQLNQERSSELTRALVACLRHVGQKNADFITKHSFDCDLFQLLETESEREIQEEIISSLESFVTLFGQSHSWRWLDICKSIIVSSKIPSPACFRTQAGHDNGQDDREDDEEQATGLDHQSEEKRMISFHTMSCAARILSTLVSVVASSSSQLHSVSEASQLPDSQQQIVLRLGELVNLICRLNSVPCVSVRSVSLEALCCVIDTFSDVEDPAMPDLLLLSMWMSPIKAVIRSSLLPDVDPKVRIAACSASVPFLVSIVASDDSLVFERFTEALCSPLNASSATESYIIELYNERVLLQLKRSHCLALSLFLCHPARPRALRKLFEARAPLLREALSAIVQDEILVLALDTNTLRHIYSRLVPSSPLDFFVAVGDREEALFITGLCKLLTMMPKEESEDVQLSAVEVTLGASLQLLEHFARPLPHQRAPPSQCIVDVLSGLRELCVHPETASVVCSWGDSVLACMRLALEAQECSKQVAVLLLSVGAALLKSGIEARLHPVLLQLALVPIEGALRNAPKEDPQLLQVSLILAQRVLAAQHDVAQHDVALLAQLSLALIAQSEQPDLIEAASLLLLTIAREAAEELLHALAASIAHILKRGLAEAASVDSFEDVSESRLSALLQLLALMGCARPSAVASAAVGALSAFVASDAIRARLAALHAIEKLLGGSRDAPNSAVMRFMMPSLLPLLMTCARYPIETSDAALSVGILCSLVSPDGKLLEANQATVLLETLLPLFLVRISAGDGFGLQQTTLLLIESIAATRPLEFRTAISNSPPEMQSAFQSSVQDLKKEEVATEVRSKKKKKEKKKKRKKRKEDSWVPPDVDAAAEFADFANFE